jgi:hypothetical protein
MIIHGAEGHEEASAIIQEHKKTMIRNHRVSSKTDQGQQIQ